jgi:Tfp pilus assembly pilus retraction ATPase PilT
MRTGIQNLESYKKTDVQLYDYLLKSKSVPQEALNAALLETAVNNEPLSNIIVRNGFISQMDIIDLMIKLEPEYLVDEQVIIPTIEPEILTSMQTMIHAVTIGHVYLATTKSEQEVVDNLKIFFPNHKFEFIPCDVEKLDSYLERANSIFYDEGSLVEKVIRKAIQNNVSDIHIVPHHDTYSVLYRYLGVRYVEYISNKEEYLSLVARIKDLSRIDMTEKRVPQDGGFALDYNGKMVDLRVATIPNTYGEQVVIRILDPDKAQFSLTQLGISNIQDWRKGSSRADGLCLICGPTGSGKTTTLNSTLRELDRFGKAIYTIEDPVEYRIPYIGQVNINPAVGLDFARAVKAFMRADPDVIVIGEIRDAETARNAIKAAETGHLVFATLHTGSIPGAINRLRDLGVEAHELKYVLRSVMAQRLIRIICKICNGDGCTHCFDKGYSGRTIVSEIKHFSSMKEVIGIIATKETDVEITWETIQDDAYKKVKSGESSPGEFIRTFGSEAEDILINDGYDLSKIDDKGIYRN